MTHSVRMTWVDLAFLHWPVPVETLRPLVPSLLEIETFDGSAWIGVTPFEMRNVRPLMVLPVPTAMQFPELNVRTYVKYGGRSGVWFFSLDAGSWLAVAGARALVNLPYFHAKMSAMRGPQGITYRSVRTHPLARSAQFRARYRPTGDVFTSVPGSFEHWATERYSLFSHLPGSGGRLLRLDIEHARWPLQPGAADIELNTMAEAARIPLPATPPRVLFSRSLDVRATWPTPL